MQNGNNQETEEVRRQTHGNINYYYVTVNSFNFHSIRMEDCYNSIPVTSPSFFCLHTTLSVHHTIMIIRNINGLSSHCIVLRSSRPGGVSHVVQSTFVIWYIR
jgi:hypothetical protein